VIRRLIPENVAACPNARHRAELRAAIFVSSKVDGRPLDQGFYG